MRFWSVLGSLPLMGSSVLGWSHLMARWIDSTLLSIISIHRIQKYIHDWANWGRYGTAVVQGNAG